MRHFLDGLAALSLLLCVAASALWVFSYFRQPRLDLGYGAQRRIYFVHRGDIFEDNEPQHTFRYQVVIMPLWAVTVGSLLLPAQRVLERWRTNRQVRIGRCSNCGYDHRATPDRCPECGTVPKKST
jgi:hypothetical protein